MHLLVLSELVLTRRPFNPLAGNINKGLGGFSKHLELARLAMWWKERGYP
jgi:hypothetical protein